MSESNWEWLGPAQKSSIRLPAITKVHFNALHRVLLYTAASVWFMAYVLSQQRNYQDAWILDGILWPFVALVIVFLYVLSTEKDNGVVALLSAWTILIITLIPFLKYTQPYGTSIDAADHYLMVQNLMENGSILPYHTYSSIPAMHTWLASLGLTSGLSEATILQLGLPLTGTLMPLLIYWWTRFGSIPNDIAKYTIAASCLSVFPYYLPNGTGFSLVPLMFLLGMVLMWEINTFPQRKQYAYTIIILISLFQIIFWHSTTPMLLPLMFATAALTPVLAWLIQRTKPNLGTIRRLLSLSLLTLVMFIAYRLLVNDPVLVELMARSLEVLNRSETTQVSIPGKLFEVTWRDAAVTTYLIHGRSMLLYAMTGIGALVLLGYRARLQAAVFFYAYFLLIFSMMTALIFTAAALGINYNRFLNTAIAFSPFFVGPFLWWVNTILLKSLFPLKWLSRLAAVVLAALLISYTTADFFSLQLLVPKIRSTERAGVTDDLVWLHAVNSAYQQRMMTFAEHYTQPETRFAIDVNGHRQFTRYFGSRAALRRGLYLPLYRQQKIDPQTVSLFLLHWPGPAGGLGERIESRSMERLIELRETPNWGLVYDNGESFILWIR